VGAPEAHAPTTPRVNPYDTEGHVMLSAERLQEIVAEVSYRDSWTMTIDDEPWEGPVLWIVADVPNSYRPNETVTLRIESKVPPMADRDAFLAWLLWRLIQIESHEAREWFKVDGKTWSDPHAERITPARSEVR
jgi:hypothetical protein